jgi:hypothetical protein
MILIISSGVYKFYYSTQRYRVTEFFSKVVAFPLLRKEGLGVVDYLPGHAW